MHARAMLLLRKQQASDVMEYAPIARALTTMDSHAEEMLKKKFDAAYVLGNEGITFTKMMPFCQLKLMVKMEPMMKTETNMSTTFYHCTILHLCHVIYLWLSFSDLKSPITDCLIIMLKLLQSDQVIPWTYQFCFVRTICPLVI